MLKMLKIIILSAALVVLPSAVLIATEEIPPVLQQQEAPKPTDPVSLQPKALQTIDPATVYISHTNAKLDKKGKRAVKLAEKWIDRPILPTVEKKDGSIIYTFGASLPVIVCKPLRVSVLQLELDEKIIDPPRCGDTAQWDISPSKPNDKRPVHIYIKPLDSGLTTNLVVATDRRTYILALKSRNDKYTPLVSFRYPENQRQEWEEHLAEQQRIEEQHQYHNRIKSSSMVFDVEKLDFKYDVAGSAKWKPLRVFNDGQKTYLQMPDIMSMYEAPVLMAVNDGKEALINYRLHDDLFIVDQLFDKAILVSGVGRHQIKITITRETQND